MMGYDLNQFRNQAIDEEFLCSICYDVLKDPVRGKCEHVFCRKCIQTWLHQYDSPKDCPCCKAPIRKSQLKSTPRYVISISLNNK